MNTQPKALRRAILAALALGGLSLNAQAIEFEFGELSGSWDTTISYGAAWRVEDRDDSNIGKAQFNPFIFLAPIDQQVAAPGRFSVNGDDGNQNFDDGDLINHTLKFTSEVGFSWRNFGGFFRVLGFHDFELQGADFLDFGDERFGDPDRYVGGDLRMLDAFMYWDFELGERLGTIRLGRQVVSWGESTFIQGGINVVNPVDVSRLRSAGAELKEAFLPIDMVYTSLDLTDNVSVEALYMFEFEQIDPDYRGSYFATNDFGVPGGQFAMLGFGLFDEQTPLAPVTIPRTFDRAADDDGQFGIALRWFAPELNQTEFGFYYLNYHSRLPLISGFAVTNSSPESGRYFLEYPEDIELWGASFNTEIAGLSFAGEVSYRDNLPLQIDDVEVLFSALSPLNAGVPSPFDEFRSQLGQFSFGEQIQGWDEHEVSQAQLTITKLIGPNNFFGANQIAALIEIGATKVWDLPAKSVLRYNGPATDTGGGPSLLDGGTSRNPVTGGGFPDDFSWGYRFITRLDYNSVFGTPWNLSPRLAFNHDVNGTTPGPGGNFIEDRKQLTLGVAGNYLSKWGADLSYTRYFGAGNFNELRDRDFVGFSVSYAF